MTDIHSHILPDVDDGSRSWEESLEMISNEAEGGTRVIITTPHVLDTPDLDRVPLFRERLVELRSRLAEAAIAVDIHPGVELYPFWNALEAMDQGVPLGLGESDTYVLIDTPFNQLPHDFEPFLFALQTRGKTPILAHPERSTVFQSDPGKLMALEQRGLILQVNAGSLRNRYGEVAKAFAERLLTRRLAHMVASDIHRPADPPLMGFFREQMSERLGEDYVNLLTVESPAAVAAGRPLPERPPAPPEEQPGFLAKLFPGKKPTFKF